MLQNIIVMILVWAIAGLLCSEVFQKNSLWLLGNIIVGMIWGYVGNRLLVKMDLSLWTGYLAAIFTGALWSIVLLALINLLLKDK